jgi:hypothetical protein
MIKDSVVQGFNDMKFNIVIFNNKEQEVRDLLLSIDQFFIQDILDEYKNMFKVFMVCDGKVEDYASFLLDITKDLSYQLDIKYNNLNGNFAEHKNFIHDYIPNDEYVIQFDSDEWVHHIFFLNIKRILENNPDIDLIYLSRDNKVEGVTTSYLIANNWMMDSWGRINFPDWQGRIYRKTDTIEWEGKVHERIVGHKKFLKLEHFSNQVWDDFGDEKYTVTLKHHKQFKKQIEQNNFYNQIIENK